MPPLRALAFAAALATALPAFAQTQNPSFNLLNRGASPIVELFVTPAGDARWGQNRLRVPIPVGGSYQVRRRIDGNCIFDVRVVFADHRILDRRNLNTCNTDDVAVGAGGAPASAAGPASSGGKVAGVLSFRLLNQAAQPVVELFATPAGLANWGQNRLSAPLAPLQARAIEVARQPNSCLYDLKVVFADHTARERHRSDLCRTTELPVR